MTWEDHIRNSDAGRANPQMAEELIAKAEATLESDPASPRQSLEESLPLSEGGK